MTTISFTHIRIRMQTGSPVFVPLPNFFERIGPVFAGFKLGAEVFGSKRAKADAQRSLESLQVCAFVAPDLITHFARTIWPDTAGWSSVTSIWTRFRPRSKPPPALVATFTATALSARKPGGLRPQQGAYC